MTQQRSAYLVSRVIKFFDGSEVAAPLRVVASEEEAKRLIQEYDRDLRGKMESGMVVERQSVEDSANGEPDPVFPVGSLATGFRAELSIFGIDHSVLPVPFGQPSRVVPAPSVRLS